jgi:hypothetical protein
MSTARRTDNTIRRARYDSFRNRTELTIRST